MGIIDDEIYGIFFCRNPHIHQIVFHLLPLLRALTSLHHYRQHPQQFIPLVFHQPFDQPHGNSCTVSICYACRSRLAPAVQEAAEIDYYIYSSLPLQIMFDKRDYAMDKY